MADRNKLPITLVVITFNEAAHIGQCLDSVDFAAEKIVVDSGSTDGTPEIATRHGARVVRQSWLGFGQQRNAAAAAARHDWILMLDADEEMTDALATELKQRLPQLLASSKAGAVLRRRTSYMGAPMRWYRPMTRERVTRLYHRQRARWTQARVHEALHFDAAVEEFAQPFLHHHNPTLVHKHLKMLSYAELKLRDWLERGRPDRLWMCPLVFAATFFKDYFLRLAFLDGWRGYVVAQIAASYAVYRRMRYHEMRRNPQSIQQADELLRRRGLLQQQIEDSGAMP